MKRYMRAWLAVALCVALAGGAALAEGRDPLDLELGEPTVAALQAPEDALAIDLDGGALDGAPAEPEAPAEEARPNETVSNRIVIKRYISYEISKGEATVLTADRAITEAYIEDEVKGYPVTRIAPEAFAGCKKLWKVTMPDSMVEIGDRAFDSCIALVSVEIPESVEKFGVGLFGNCTMLSHFELPEGMEEITEGMFENCQMLWKVYIPTTVRRIADRAFARCLSLKEFTLPEGLKEIGVSAFERCEAIKHLKIPEGISEIPDCAFKDCVDLRDVKLPAGLTSIGESAFHKCDSMRKLTLPAALEEMGPFAFAYCEDIKTLTIPAKLDTVSYGAFFHCAELEEVQLKYGVNEIEDYAFAQCRKLVKVEIPESVDTMGDDVFTMGEASRISDDEVELDEPLKQPKKLTLYGRPNSAASAYAKEYGIPFVVKKIPATSITIAEGDSATIYVGHPMQLTAVLEPANAESKVKWSSDSSSVMVSSTGLLTPRHSGKATITAKTDNGKKDSIKIKVIDARSVSIVEGKSATLRVGETLQLHATVEPEEVTTRLSWSSGSKRTASVSDTGLVKAKKKGTATITVRTANGKKAKIKIKVVA